ncbi:MAG TPA: biotin/lipoyl-containing protein [Ktedonobacterales bacterium]|nr:biotin/lipoyl-containing protein [Ktedonobacterales bacterium]
MARERADRNGDLPQNTQTTLSVAELRQLITLMNGGDIGEITIEEEASGLKLTLRKPALAPQVVAVGADGFYDEDGDEATPADGEASAAPETRVAVTAPFVGYFRAAAKPGAKPLVAGDVVKAGNILGAIEALNVLNEVEAPVDGRLAEALVADGQPVEYGQPLMTIETKQ